MSAVEWIDLQTDAVAVSTLIYTQGMVLFTSLTVTFEVDAAGHVDGVHHETKSWL
jgi:hypothetical protein